MRTINSKIAGVTKDNRQEFIREHVDAKDGLVMEREPENQYDPNAIAIYYDGTLDEYVKLGFVTSVLAAKLAPLMDSGWGVDGEVTEVTGQDQDTLGVNIMISVYEPAENKARMDKYRTIGGTPAPLPQPPNKQTKPKPQKVYVIEKSNKSYLALVLYWIFLGYFGGHRFYAGRGSLLYTLTIGYFLIGWIIDGFLIFTGMFKDSRGIEIKP